jgi:hypothetical protein
VTEQNADSAHLSVTRKMTDAELIAEVIRVERLTPKWAAVLYIEAAILEAERLHDGAIMLDLLTKALRSLDEASAQNDRSERTP